MSDNCGSMLARESKIHLTGMIHEKREDRPISAITNSVKEARSYVVVGGENSAKEQADTRACLSPCCTYATLGYNQ